MKILAVDTSSSNCSIDIVGVEVIPLKPETTSLYIALAISFIVML